MFHMHIKTCCSQAFSPAIDRHSRRGVVDTMKNKNHLLLLDTTIPVGTRDRYNLRIGVIRGSAPAHIKFRQDSGLSCFIRQLSLQLAAFGLLAAIPGRSPIAIMACVQRNCPTVSLTRQCPTRIQRAYRVFQFMVTKNMWSRLCTSGYDGELLAFLPAVCQKLQA